MTSLAHALIVIDAQRGFADAGFWGVRNNPGCEANIVRLVRAWRTAGLPVVYVRHDSDNPHSPLFPGGEGHKFIEALPASPDLLISKRVNSAFHGVPDLDAWLRERPELYGIVVCGITTNHCCETTARIGGNLGHDVLFALDATHTFDRIGPDGIHWSAETLAAATAANLHGEFARVVSTERLLADVANPA